MLQLQYITMHSNIMILSLWLFLAVLFNLWFQLVWHSFLKSSTAYQAGSFDFINWIVENNMNKHKNANTRIWGIEKGIWLYLYPHELPSELNERTAQMSAGAVNELRFSTTWYH